MSNKTKSNTTKPEELFDYNDFKDQLAYTDGLKGYGNRQGVLRPVKVAASNNKLKPSGKFKRIFS